MGIEHMETSSPAHLLKGVGAAVAEGRGGDAGLEGGADPVVVSCGMSSSSSIYIR